MYLGVLLMIVSLAGVFEFLAPRLTDARANLASDQAKLKGLQSDVDVLTTAKNQLAQDEKALQDDRGVDFTKLPLIYPKTEDMPGLYLQLEALMQRGLAEGVTSPSYQVTAPVLDATEGSVHIPVTISAIGQYAQLKTFIALLEQNLRPISIQTINLSQTLDKDKGTPSGLFTLNVAGIVRAESLSSAYSGTPTN